MISISASGISYRIGTRTILEDITFALEEGDRLGIVGVNGSGKSTLLKLLTDEYTPDEGTVTIGKNKIVGSLDEAYERTRRDCCPGNARRQGFKTPCALVGECNDCRSADRMCRVVTIHEMPTRRVKAFHILIVDQDLGL